MYSFFFFNDTATTEIYTLSLHDALPISTHQSAHLFLCNNGSSAGRRTRMKTHRYVHRTTRRTSADTVRSAMDHRRSEEHTSELQSRQYLVCRLLLEKKK